VILNAILALLALLSLVLLLWQWLAAWRFPLHERVSDKTFAPAVTLLKPLKGCDAATEECLRSWFAQEYAGEVQILFGVASASDPAGEVVRKLLGEFPGRDARLVLCDRLIGANAKVSQLVELQKIAKHEVLAVSDADVKVPADFLANAVFPLSPKYADGKGAGLVNCFYRLANPVTPAMQWEAVAINSDFWSQVLQSKSLKPLDFALGAVMVTRRKQLDEIGGFTALADCLADDYQLGNRIARQGHGIALCPVVVDCWDPPMTWGAVWKHQLRWARTIRVCQPAPYFFSILSNATLWPLLWFLVNPTKLSLGFFAGCIGVRGLAAMNLQRRLNRSRGNLGAMFFAPAKDLLQTVIWFCAFAGSRIEWRGQKYRLRKDGTLVAS
jgi:ceramide glucosyltransferase